MPLQTSPLRGSQAVDTFSTLSFVDVLFCRGIPETATLRVSYLPEANALRFYVEEISGESLNLHSGDSILEVPAAPYSTDPNAYTVAAYSPAGGIMVLRVRPGGSVWDTFVQTASAPGSRVFKALSEVVKTQVSTAGAVSALNTTLNREVGTSFFDASYWGVFNRRFEFPASLPGYMVFLSSGFSNAPLWVKQWVDPTTKDLFGAVASSLLGDDADFGTPVLLLKNNGTPEAPAYTYPAVPRSLPTTKYAFSTSGYTSSSGETSPLPYYTATTKDGSILCFTLHIAEVVLADRKGVLTSPFTGHDLRRLQTVGGFGGGSSGIPVPPALTVLPTKAISGVRVVSTGGGVLGKALHLKQAVSIVGGGAMVSEYPALDTKVRFSLAASDDGGVTWGAPVDTSISGMYTLKTPGGGELVVATNRLLYNPYYTASEKLSYSQTPQALFSAITPEKCLVGDVEYRCIILRNDHPTQTLTSLKVWSGQNCNYPYGDIANPQYMQFGAKVLGGEQNPVSADGKVSPQGITFGFLNAESDALVFSSVAPGTEIALWFKRVINPGAPVAQTETDVSSFLRYKVTI